MTPLRPNAREGLVTAAIAAAWLVLIGWILEPQVSGFRNAREARQELVAFTSALQPGWVPATGWRGSIFETGGSRAYGSGSPMANDSSRMAARQTGACLRRGGADYFAGAALTANRLVADRTNITPFDSAGVAISGSPIELVATCLNVRPASMTSISPSSFDR